MGACNGSVDCKDEARWTSAEDDFVRGDIDDKLAAILALVLPYLLFDGGGLNGKAVFRSAHIVQRELAELVA